MASKTDKLILRELAKRYMEIAEDDINRKRIDRMRSVNDLKPARPPVILYEIPWHEMDISDQLHIHCSDPDARKMEFYFRTRLFMWKYIQADMVAEDRYYIDKAFTSTGIGVEINETTIATDTGNNVLAHCYNDQLDTESKVDVLHEPVITARPDIDEDNLARTEDILHGIMPVALRGHGIYYPPWDDISKLRGVEPILIDLKERPLFLHKTIQKFTEIGLSKYQQMEEQGLLDYDIQSLHGTPRYVSDLPAKDHDGGKVRLKDVWFRGMAQIFSVVSPEMHEEFDLQYMRRLMDKCGLSYYGCCEPLHNKLELLFKVPNLRKISISPWADVRQSAEKIGTKYVISRKPDPSYVAGVFDPDVVRAEISQTIEACIRYECPYEFVLKDISTVSYKPQNLIYWVKTVTETIDSYY